MASPLEPTTKTKPVHDVRTELYESPVTGDMITVTYTTDVDSIPPIRHACESCGIVFASHVIEIVTVKTNTPEQRTLCGDCFDWEYPGDLED